MGEERRGCEGRGEERRGWERKGWKVRLKEGKEENEGRGGGWGK